MSLYHLLKQYPGEDLIKKPSKWTHHHVRLLSSFQDPLPVPVQDMYQMEGGTRGDYMKTLLNRSEAMLRMSTTRMVLEHPGYKVE